MGPVLAALVWLASPGAPAPAPNPTVGTERGRAIVFLIGDEQPRAAAVAEAVRTQIADLDARLEIEPLPASTELGARLVAAREQASVHRAVGVFWLEVEPDGDLLLHLVDPDGERMLVRRVQPSPESDTAAVQTVAVIARGFTSALLEGRAIGLYRVETTRPPATDDELPPLGGAEEPLIGPRSRRGRLRIGAAYYGAYVAPQRDWVWQSGLATSLAWQWPVGVYAGVGYDVTRAFIAATRSEIAMTIITSQVRRNPASVIAGYQQRWPQHRLALDGELRVLVDVHTVRNDGITIVEEREIAPFVLLSPRAALHFRPVPHFSAHVTAGAEIILYGQDFVAEFRDEASTETVDEQTYLTPAILRPLVLAGITLYL